MMIYQEFLAMNEELAAFDPNDRLRWAVHEIVMKLKWNEEIKFEALSILLKKEYKVDVPTDILKEIFTRWDRYNDPEYTIFTKEDKNWLDVWPHANYLKRKAKRDKQNFGKHRKKEITPYVAPAGRSSYYDGGFTSGYYKNRTPDQADDAVKYGWD